MLRPSLLGALLLLAACNDSDEEVSDPIRVTRIVVRPSEFLGDLECGEPDSVVTYQATLVDVTLGLDEAFELPSSSVIGCQSTVAFEFVEPGRRYIARVVAFDRDDLESQHPGSPVVVDEDGVSVQPRWTTTCLGDDRIDYSGFGGASGGFGGDGAGGEGLGGLPELGVEAYFRAAVVVRGCQPLVEHLP